MRATSQSPCLHGTLRSAAITIKTRKACFYRLNAFWLVTVKVLNSYVLEYGQSKIEYLKTPHGAYDRNMEMIYLL